MKSWLLKRKWGVRLWAFLFLLLSPLVVIYTSAGYVYTMWNEELQGFYSSVFKGIILGRLK